MSDVGSEQLEFVTCDYCEQSFDIGVRYPVAVREGPDGDLELYSFCDAACQQAWETENP